MSCLELIGLATICFIVLVLVAAGAFCAAVWVFGKVCAAAERDMPKGLDQ